MYTQDWNSEFIHNTTNIKNLNLCLEIGCFEGLTSNYIVDNLLSTEGKLICVDPLQDKYLTENLSEFDSNNNNTVYKYFEGQYKRFVENVSVNLESGKIILIRDTSFNVYNELIKKYKNQFDFIYIDGDHRADYVYKDALNCFKLCKSGGYILFDDYRWGTEYGEQSTKNGIDKFLVEFEGQYQTVIKKNQCLIVKT